MIDRIKLDQNRRVPTFPAAGLILLGPATAQVACNAEAVRILAYPATSVPPKRVNGLIAEKLPTWAKNQTIGEGEIQNSELASGKRRYLCSRYILDMHGPEPRRTMAILLERVGSPEVTMHELCDRFNLTVREREAVGFLVKGMTSKEIAQQMGISPNTVKSFLRLVMTKAGVSTRAGLIGRVAGISLQPSPSRNMRMPEHLRMPEHSFGRSNGR